MVRDLAEKALGNLGYRVLTAGSTADARAVAERHRGPIALMVTDVELPDGSGIELAEGLLAARTDMRVLVITGHAVGDVGSGEWPFDTLGKRFTLADLAARVRGLLAGTAGADPASPK